jgi:hypothetical protein
MEDMPDPLVGTVLAKALGTEGAQSEKAATGLFVRVLGPSADEIGEALRRYTAYRLRNVGRIVSNADAKAGDGGEEVIVNPRVARVLVEEGSYCDDDLMTNYLGGVLAGSRTHDGRDDRAVTWSRLITDLSGLQVRAHYLLYREWAARLEGIVPFNLGDSKIVERAVMQIDLEEFNPELARGSGVDYIHATPHAIIGLAGANLIDDSYALGRSRRLLSKGAGVRSSFAMTLEVRPSRQGIELYGWAQGLPGLLPAEFTSKAVPFDLGDPISRLTKVNLPNLGRYSGKVMSATPYHCVAPKGC